MWLSTKLPSLLLQGNSLRGIDNCSGHTTEAKKNKQGKLEHIEDNGFISKKILGAVLDLPFDKLWLDWLC